jgi:hypothetical protein
MLPIGARMDIFFDCKYFLNLSCRYFGDHSPSQVREILGSAGFVPVTFRMPSAYRESHLSAFQYVMWPVFRFIRNNNGTSKHFYASRWPFASLINTRHAHKLVSAGDPWVMVPCDAVLAIFRGLLLDLLCAY